MFAKAVGVASALASLALAGAATAHDDNGYSRQPHIHIGAWRDEVALQIRFDQKKMRSERAAVSDRPDKAAILNALGLDKYEHIAFRNSDGEAISDSEFIEALLAGERFSIEKDEAQSRATLSFSHMDPSASGSQRNKIAVATGEVFPTEPLDHVKEMHEQAVLINFFFADCAPCIQEIPALNAFQKARPDVAVVAVTFDDADTARQFRESHGLEWPIVSDAADYIDSVGVSVYPTLALVSGDGHLAGVKTSGIVSITGGNIEHFNVNDWVASLQQDQKD